MKVLFDTTFLVEIDRKNKEAINLAKILSVQDAEMIVSTITVSEILAGTFLRKDHSKAFENARMALAQFDWKDFEGSIAMKTAELLAFQIVHGSPTSFQDTAIAATALENKADFLVTENKKHFEIFPELKNKVKTIKEALKGQGAR